MDKLSGTGYWSNKTAIQVDEEEGVEAGKDIPEILIVVWKDAYEEASWEELTVKECLVTSVGFNGGEKNGYQMLYGSVILTDDPPMTGAVLRIPIENIREIWGCKVSIDC